MKNSELDGLFASNESTSVGALRALQSQKRVGKIKMVGFDSSKLLVDGIKDGVIDSLVMQDPFKIGYEGVKAAIDKLDGKEVRRRIDTGAVLVTKENMETAEIRALLE